MYTLNRDCSILGVESFPDKLPRWIPIYLLFYLDKMVYRVSIIIRPRQKKNARQVRNES